MRKVEINMDEKKAIKMPHSLIMQDRRNLSVSGVLDVDSFDEQMIVLFTEQGELTIKGSDLHINKLSVDTGELSVEGYIDSLYYSEEKTNAKSGFFAKLFK